LLVALNKGITENQETIVSNIQMLKEKMGIKIEDKKTAGGAKEVKKES